MFVQLLLTDVLYLNKSELIDGYSEFSLVGAGIFSLLISSLHFNNPSTALVV